MGIEFIIGLTVVIGVLLMVIILAQNPKGGGLSSAFGGSGTSQMIGVKKTTDILEKITWVLITLVFALSLSTGLLIDRQPANLDGQTEIERNAQDALQQDQPADQGNSILDGLAPAEEGGEPAEGEPSLAPAEDRPDGDEE